MNLLAKISSLFEQKKMTTATAQSVFRFLLPSGNRFAHNGLTLESLYRRNELAFACINKIADVMNDAEIIVEKMNSKGEYEVVKGHLLSSMLKRPNGEEVGSDFRRKIVQSENFAGLVYFHLARTRPFAPPFAVYILNPNRVMPEVNHSTGRIEFYRYTDILGFQTNIAPADIVIKRRTDLTDEYGGLAPLAVAANVIDADENLTDYINSFLDADGGGGIPSGILKVNKTLSPEQASMMKKLWNKNTKSNEINVVDQNAEYQALGSKLSEIASDSIRAQNDARICGVFGVPAILVSAYVGYLHTTQNATAKSALKDFWFNKISPELKILREWLTWNLLPLFEDENLIRQEKIRVNFDLSQMLALQEDVTDLHDRARANFTAGGWTLNEFREATGRTADAKGDYYLQPMSLDAISPENRAAQAKQKIEQGTNPNEPKLPQEDDEAEEKSDIKLLTEKKTFDFDGLTLWREPNEAEKLCVKSLADDLSNRTEDLQSAMFKYRDALINQAVIAAKDLDEKTIHALTLERNEKQAKFIEKSLTESLETGRSQIVREISAQSKKSFEKKDDDKNRISEISNSVLAQILNEIQSRTITVYVALKLLDTNLEDFYLELKKRLLEESKKFLESLSGNSANLAIQQGRSEEIEAQKDNWNRIQYSAILDKATCPSCRKADGMEAKSADKLPKVPNKDCDGSIRCRCFHVVILD